MKRCSAFSSWKRSTPTLARLSGGGFEMVEGRSTEPDDYASQARDCATILTRGKGRIDARILSDSPLRCVGRCGAGVDNIDVAAATRLKIPVLYSPDSTTRAVAEHTLARPLQRHVNQHHDSSSP